MIGPLPDDPVILAIVAILLALIFFFYLMIRKTLLEFQRGMQGE